MDKHELILRIYLLVIYFLSCVTIIKVLWTCLMQRSFRNSKELKIIIHILFADLLWCALDMFDIVCDFAKTQIHYQLKIINLLQYFALMVSMAFAVITAFCAYKTLSDTQYLYKANNYRMMLVFGYMGPFISTCIFYFVEPFDLFNFELYGQSLIVFPSVSVILSLFFYLRIFQLFGKLDLSANQRAEINQLFTYPLIIFLFLLVPNSCTSLAQRLFDVESTEFVVIRSIATLVFSFYALVNCWAYGKSIKVLTKSGRKTKTLSYDSNLQVSLIQEDDLDQSLATQQEDLI